MTRVLAVMAALMALSGCAGQQHDLEGVRFGDVQKAEGFNNVDQHPNLVRFCIDGVAFVSSTREGTNVVRIPEWDTSYCGKVTK